MFSFDFVFRIEGGRAGRSIAFNFEDIELELAMMFVLFLLFLFLGKEAGAYNSVSSELSKIRSTTYYNYPDQIGGSERFVSDLKNDIDIIVANKFNALWLIVEKLSFDPEYTFYKKLSFDNLKSTLDLLKSRNMKAIIPINYGFTSELAYKTGWCSILNDPVEYRQMIRYTTNFLTEIQNYSNDVYILLFSEAFWGCNGTKKWPGVADGDKLVPLIKNTFGRLPLDLPVDLRSKFKIGFHDDFLARGLMSGGQSPIFDDKTYDFYSFAIYGYPDRSSETLIASIDSAVNRVRSEYPNLPLFAGEVGAGACSPSNEDIQANQDRDMVTHILNKNIGLNVWQWKPKNFRDGNNVADCAFGGHSLTNWDGSLRKAAVVLKEVLKPSAVCTGGGPVENPNVGTNMTNYDVFAYGVENATSVFFPTWSEIDGQDDLFWYPGTNVGNGTWKATIDFSKHPGLGQFGVHVYLDGKSNQCGTANFVRSVESMVGDYNNDNKVDLVDFSLWKIEYLAGRSTLVEFSVWKKAYLMVYLYNGI